MQTRLNPVKQSGQNPAPLLEQNKPSIGAQAQGLRRVIGGVWIFCLLGLAATLVAVFAAGALQSVLILSGLFLFEFLAGLAAYRILRPPAIHAPDAIYPPGRLVRAAFILIVSTIAACLLAPVFFRGLALPSVLLSILLVVLVFHNLPSRHLPIMLMVAVGTFLLGFMIDFMASANRPVLFPLLVSQILLIVLLAVIGIVILNHIGNYPLRTKITIVFLAIGIASIALIAYFAIVSIRTSLTQTADKTLNTASQAAMNAVDMFISTTLETMDSQAQLQIWSQFYAARGERDELEWQQAVEAQFREFMMPGVIGEGQAGNRRSFLLAYMLLDTAGQVILDTRESLPQASPVIGSGSSGRNYGNSDFFQNSITSSIPYVSAVEFTRDDRAFLYFSDSVTDASGSRLGVIVAVYNAAVLQQIVGESNNLAGDQSYAILLDDNYLSLANGLSTGLPYRFVIPTDTDRVHALIQAGRIPDRSIADLSPEQPELGLALQSPSAKYIKYGDGQLASITASTIKPWTMVYTQAESYFLAPLDRQAFIIKLIASLLVAVMAMLTGVGLSHLIGPPLRRLAGFAETAAAGDWATRLPAHGEDELAVMAQALNGMKDSVQQQVAELDGQFQERVRLLDRRSQQLQAAAEVGRAASTIHNVDELLVRVAGLIGDRFDFYHVGIFLLDEAREYAVLRATNSDGGKRMLQRQHKLAVGQQGIVGNVTGNAQARIALDVGEDATFFNNPDLPQTRSEMALPLIAGGNLFGALDVQSTQPEAFSRDDVIVMQVLVDLIAVAIENARLFVSGQEAIESAQRAYGEISRLAWQERLRAQTEVGYRSIDRGVTTLSREEIISGALQRSDAASSSVLTLPIKVRDTVVGYLDTLKPSASVEWSDEDLQIVNTLVDQVGIALESARLYESSLSQAQRERLISEITSRLQGSLDVEAVLSTAAQEIYQAMGLQDVTIVLSEPTAAGAERDNEDHGIVG